MYKNRADFIATTIIAAILAIGIFVGTTLWDGFTLYQSAGWSLGVFSIVELILYLGCDPANPGYPTTNEEKKD